MENLALIGAPENLRKQAHGEDLATIDAAAKKKQRKMHQNLAVR